MGQTHGTVFGDQVSTLQASVVIAAAVTANPGIDPFDTSHGAIPISPPGSVVETNARSSTRSLELLPHTLFLNFDGAVMQRCGLSNSPLNNCSTVHHGVVLPFSGGPLQRASILQIVRARLAPFDVQVTDTRPLFGDYDMVMIGDWDPPPSSGNFAGIAPAIDCWDGDGGEVSFALEYTSVPDGMAEVILQEAAHTWGLSHVGERNDLMYPTTAGNAKTFTDQCTPIVRDSNGTAGTSFCSHHGDACGSQDMQNSHAELLMVLGPGAADVSPPDLDVLEPGHDQVVATEMDVVARVSDDVGPGLLTLRVNVAGPIHRRIVHRVPAPVEYTVTLSDLPPGTYDLLVSLFDESDNVTTDRRWFQVPDNPELPKEEFPESETSAPPTVAGHGCTLPTDWERAHPSWWLIVLLVIPRQRRMSAAQPVDAPSNGS